MPKKMDCVKNISTYDNDCLNRCEGLFITGFERREFEKDQVDKVVSLVKNEYEKFKVGDYPRFVDCRDEGLVPIPNNISTEDFLIQKRKSDLGCNIHTFNPPGIKGRFSNIN